MAFVEEHSLDRGDELRRCQKEVSAVDVGEGLRAAEYECCIIRCR